MMRFWRVGLWAGLFAASALGVSNTELNRLWRGHYHAQFNVQWPLADFEEGSGTHKIAEGFYHLHAPALTKNSNNYAPEFYSIARGWIRSTSYTDVGCQPYWMAYMSGGNMWICPGFVNQSAESRTSNLFHEASHGRLGDPGHVTCAHGVYEGKPVACDQTFHQEFAGSGYNHQFMYLWWVRDASTSHSLDRDQMTAMIRWLVANQFNEVTNAQIQRWAP